VQADALELFTDGPVNLLRASAMRFSLRNESVAARLERARINIRPIKTTKSASCPANSIIGDVGPLTARMPKTSSATCPSKRAKDARANWSEARTPKSKRALSIVTRYRTVTPPGKPPE
jgi:hypothetical protein